MVALFVKRRHERGLRGKGAHCVMPELQLKFPEHQLSRLPFNQSSEVGLPFNPARAKGGIGCGGAQFSEIAIFLGAHGGHAPQVVVWESMERPGVKGPNGVSSLCLGL